MTIATFHFVESWFTDKNPARNDLFIGRNGKPDLWIRRGCYCFPISGRQFRRTVDALKRLGVSHMVLPNIAAREGGREVRLVLLSGLRGDEHEGTLRWVLPEE
ncbi:MAG: hypothetical protein F4X67_14190 [Gemmatimonadales bacterium]|nr:hypothetical protein [Gemmatimonadales bacterium]